MFFTNHQKGGVPVNTKSNNFEEQYKTLFYLSLQGIAIHEIVYDSDGNAFNYRIVEVNPAFEKYVGIQHDQIVGKLATDAYNTPEPPYFSTYKKVAQENSNASFETYFEPLGKHFKVFAYSTKKGSFVTVFTEITNEIITHEKLKQTVQNEKQRVKEMDFLLKASKGLLEDTDFAITSRKIFDYACEVTGAKSGYVALLNEDGSENELVFLEAGGIDCTVDPSLPMPIRGLRGEAYRDGKAVFHNDFMNSHWIQWIPSGHCNLKNVLFAPLNIEGKTIGIMGLANKPTDFTKEDVRICEAFGDLAALALQKWKSHQALARNEKQFRETIEQAYDGIVIADEKYQIIEWNQAQERIFGFSCKEMIGSSLRDLQKSVLPLHQGKSFHSSEFEERILHYKQQQKNPEIWDMEIKDKQGNHRYIQVTAFPIHLQGGSLFCMICRDTTEEKKIVQMKDHFVNVVTHELRTPLLSVKSSLQLLGEKELGSLNEQQNEVVSICRRNTDRLTNFINDVLDYQSLQYENSSSVFLQQDVCSVLQEMYDVVKPLSQKKDLAFSIDCDNSSIPHIDMDRNQIVRLLINVANNAVKYTKSGFVQIRVLPFVKENKIRIEIEDSGIGIRPDDQKSLFQSFVKLHSTETNGQRSTGLGLSIAKNIVDHHRGKIWAESMVGKGSTFFIELPIHQEKESKKS
jgi:PAS domain S-box-containing protein